MLCREVWKIESSEVELGVDASPHEGKACACEVGVVKVEISRKPTMESVFGLTLTDHAIPDDQFGSAAYWQIDYGCVLVVEQGSSPEVWTSVDYDFWVHCCYRSSPGAARLEAL